jgi:hypothetical protein
MATINIGNLTFTHKGDYASGTAYVKNDVVYYSTNGNAYIAKQATQGNAPTNATYWNQFAQGSGGIWNASLSLGSANQVVRVNSGGNALEFGDISSEAGKFPFHAYNSADVSAAQSANAEAVLNTELHDPNSKFNTSNGRYTPGETGVYYISGSITMNDINGAGDMLYVKFRINGDGANEYGHVRQGGASGSAYRVVSTHAVIPITNASQYISMWYYQTAGANRVLKGGMCHIEGFKIA